MQQSPPSSSSSLPSWAHPDFAAAYESGSVKPQFGWYKPRFLQQQEAPEGTKKNLSTSNNNNSHSASAAGKEEGEVSSSSSPAAAGSSHGSKFFPPFRALMERGIMDDVKDGGRQEEEAFIFGRVGQPRSAAEVWDGPALSQKLPPATDYERLLKRE